MFEIETNVDTNSKNFDRRKSELFAHNLENDSKTDEKPNVSNSQRLLNKEILKSVEVKPTLSQYCIALIRNDCPEVHLTPINSVIQFRPSFHYLDKSEINFGKNKHNSKDESEAEADASSQDESEAQTEVQTITMRFAGPDEERLRKAREKSFNYLQQQVAKDPWIELNFHPIKSHSSTEEKMSLLFNSSQDNRNDSNDSNTSFTSLENFLDSIKLSNEELLRTKSALELSSNSLEKPSLSQIRSFPLAEQVRLLLINAKILSFDQIIKLLMGKFEANSILKTLQMYALLVQGNWVVKSEILYNKETSPSSFLTGIPTELLCRARDFIIWKFTQTKSLFKKDIFGSDKNKVRIKSLVSNNFNDSHESECFVRTFQKSYYDLKYLFIYYLIIIAVVYFLSSDTLLQTNFSFK
jgi:DNA-directed RNA polymerase-3 subunit RPC5